MGVFQNKYLSKIMCYAHVLLTFVRYFKVSQKKKKSWLMNDYKKVEQDWHSNNKQLSGETWVWLVLTSILNYHFIGEIIGYLAVLCGYIHNQ